MKNLIWLFLCGFIIIIIISNVYLHFTFCCFPFVVCFVVLKINIPKNSYGFFFLKKNSVYFNTTYTNVNPGNSIESMGVFCFVFIHWPKKMRNFFFWLFIHCWITWYPKKELKNHFFPPPQFNHPPPHTNMVYRYFYFYKYISLSLSVCYLVMLLSFVRTHFYIFRMKWMEKPMA